MVSVEKHTGFAEMKLGTRCGETEPIAKDNDGKSVAEDLAQPSALHHEQCDMMFRIRAEPDPQRKPEPQRRMDSAAKLAENLRVRVTLPASFEADENVQARLDPGDRLPPVSCAPPVAYSLPSKECAAPKLWCVEKSGPRFQPQ